MEAPISGHCYCGASSLIAYEPPQVVTYCHCEDCRRLSGAPVSAFAAFSDDVLSFTPQLGAPRRFGQPGGPRVQRWFCESCGAQLAACYDYLPDQIYVPLGILDQAPSLAPERHAHADAQLPWLHIQDGLPRDAKSARDGLKNTGKRD